MLRRLGQFIFKFLVGTLVGLLILLAALSFLFIILGVVNVQFDAVIIGLLLTAVFGYGGWFIFHKYLEKGVY